MNDTMKIWDAVSKTDPEYATPVEFGRKFTAIDAHSQIMEATRQFGPIGEGWGYSAGDLIFIEGNVVIVPVTVWHGERSNYFGPVYGAAQMVGKKLDTDAPKKATTDGLTKALSLLGFNADVFLGKFDDNKYVTSLKQAAQNKQKATDDWRQAVLDTLPEKPTPLQTATAFSNAIIAEMYAVNSVAGLTAIRDNRKQTIMALQERHTDLWNKIVDAFLERKEEITNEQKEAS